MSEGKDEIIRFFSEIADTKEMDRRLQIAEDFRKLREDNAALRSEVERLSRRCAVCEHEAMGATSDYDGEAYHNCLLRLGPYSYPEEAYPCPPDGLCDLPEGQGFEPREGT